MAERHYMIVLDTDRDGVFNYINWNTMLLECWEKYGISDFYTDYSGQSAFIKIHTSTDQMKDLRLNWENPFLFYDPDRDGLSEMAIRIVDTPQPDPAAQADGFEKQQVAGRADWVSIAVDLDNDNAPGNDFDFDCTLGFMGGGVRLYGSGARVAEHARVARGRPLFHRPAFSRADRTDLCRP